MAVSTKPWSVKKNTLMNSGKKDKTPKANRREVTTPKSSHKMTTPNNKNNLTPGALSRGKKTPTKLQEDLDVSIDLTMSDEDEAAGIITRRSSDVNALEDGQVDLTRNSDNDVPSGSEEMGSLESGEPRLVAKADGSAVINKRRRIESDSESEGVADTLLKPPSKSVAESELEVKKSRFSFKSVSELKKSNKSLSLGSKNVDQQSRKKEDGSEVNIPSSNCDQGRGELSSSVQKTPKPKQSSKKRHHKTPTRHQQQDGEAQKSGTGDFATPEKLPKSANIVSKSQKLIHTPSSEKQYDDLPSSPIVHQDNNISALSESTVNTPQSTPRRSSRISRIESEKKTTNQIAKGLENTSLSKADILDTLYYSPGTPAKQQQLAALVEATLSPLKAISANVAHAVSASKQRRKSKQKEEPPVLEQVISTSPEKAVPEADQSDQVQSLLEFLEDTATALQTPAIASIGVDTGTPSSPLVETEATESSVTDPETTASTVYTTSSVKSSPNVSDARVMNSKQDKQDKSLKPSVGSASDTTRSPDIGLAPAKQKFSPKVTANKDDNQRQSASRNKKRNAKSSSVIHTPINNNVVTTPMQDRHSESSKLCEDSGDDIPSSPVPEITSIKHSPTGDKASDDQPMRSRKR